MPATPRKLEVREIDLHKPGTAAWHDARQRLLAEGAVPPEPVMSPDDGYLPVYTSHDLMFIPPPKWLIRFLVEEEGLGVVVGEKKSGKTAWLMTMLWNWVLGNDYGFDKDFYFEDPPGKTVEDRRVLYLMLEGSASYGQRLAAFARANEIDPLDERLLNFRAIRSSVNLTNQDTLQLLSKTIADWPPQILVVDTLSRATPGGEENSAKDMSSLVNVFDQIRDAYGCATIVCHHTGWTNTNRMRGSTALPGALSSEVTIKRDKTKGTRTVVIGDQRNIDDAPTEYPMRFTPHGDSFFVEAGDARSVVSGKKDALIGQTRDAAMEYLDVKRTKFYEMLPVLGLSLKDGIVVDPNAVKADAPEVL